MKALIVDDREDVMEAMDVLATHDEDSWVRVCFSAPEALDLIKEFLPEVIISDFDIPGMDGIKFIQSVNQDFPEIKMIMMTDDANEDNRLAAKEAGVDMMIMKPFDPHDGLDTARELLEERRGR